MKKMIISIGLTFIFLTMSWGVASAAQMSEWAEEEIQLALEKEMIPSVLQKDYRNQIRRYEYVLLALQIYEENHSDIDVIFQSPFSDTINHPYEKEIAKAYAVGIIKGNGNGTFRPNDYITREEVASLVVNLVKALDPYQDFTVLKKYAFSDSNQIASWSKEYISFCYQEKIMLGTGVGNDGAPKMNPKGLTTREEAVLLLYRLAINKKVYEVRDYGVLQVASEETESGVAETSVPEAFGDAFGNQMLDYLRTQIEANRILVTGINEVQIDFIIGEEGSISLFTNGARLNLQMYHWEEISPTVKAIFLEIVSLYEDPGAISDLLLRTENDLLSTNAVNYSLKETSYLRSGMEEINEIIRYYFYYEGLN